MKSTTLVLIITLFFFGSVPLWAASIELNIPLPEGGGSLIIERKVSSLEELKDENLQKQGRDFSCGSASLATVLNYYLGQSVSEVEIIKTLLDINVKKGTIQKVIERRGFTLLDLKQYAQNLGFKAIGYRLDYEDLVNLGVPAIVPIIPNGYKHFVVFRGGDGERVYLADPSAGNITEPIEKFKRDWYGFINVALVVLPPEDEGASPGGKVSALTVTELDRVFAGESEIDAFRYGGLASFNLVPWEF